MIGPSGSGKSTLMHMLGFLDQPTAGTIFFEAPGCVEDFAAAAGNHPLAENRIRIRFPGVQSPAPDDGFAEHAFTAGLQPGRKTANENFARSCQAKCSMPLAWPTAAHHRPNQLSAVAGKDSASRSPERLINEPRLILADEPTGNVDSVMAQTIMELFASLNKQGRTVV